MSQYKSKLKSPDYEVVNNKENICKCTNSKLNKDYNIKKKVLFNNKIMIFHRQIV